MTTALVILAVAVLLVLGGLWAFAAITARRVERALPRRGQLLEVGGEKLHYVQAGKGPPIVLLHGLTGQIGNFEYALVARLAERFHVVAFDRPGSGYSTRHWRGSADLRGQAGIIAEAIAALGLERPLVVGHSLGGAVALALALDHPDRVRGLALVAPLTQAGDAVPAAFRLLAIRSRIARLVVARTIAIPLTIAARRTVLATVFGPDRAPADFGLKGGGLHGLRPSAFYAASADMIAAGDDMGAIVARYGELRLPVDILFGRDDRVLSAARHGERLAAQIPQAKLELVPGGHMLPVTAPALVADFIARAHDDGESALRSTTTGD